MATPKKPPGKSGDSNAGKAAEKPSSQAEVAKKLYEKLHGKGAQAKGGPPGAGGPPARSKGFDPGQFKGGGKAGGGASNMMRRTQSRGGGSAGGGGGGGSSA